jgi:hypothetical protein
MSYNNMEKMFLGTVWCEFHIRAAIREFQRVTAINFSNTNGTRSGRTGHVRNAFHWLLGNRIKKQYSKYLKIFR